MKKICIALFFVIVLVGSFFVPARVRADTEVFTAPGSVARARVLSVDMQQTYAPQGEDVGAVSITTQELTVQILSGDTKGQIVHVISNTFQAYVGETLFVYHILNNTPGGEYEVNEPDRLPVLLALCVLFLISLFVFGGWQGVRAIATLSGSLALIFCILVPGILHGYSPVYLSLTISLGIIVLGAFITHGFNKTTAAAVLSMIGTICITGLITSIAMYAAHFTGRVSDTDGYLYQYTRGTIDLSSILFAGILIGLLGVLYDISISQAISVEELIRADASMSIKRLYQRAIRIGREHIGALVNTLAIAYVGVSLPLILYSYLTPSGSILFTINREIFSTEIIRALIGSTGLILAVPITTVIAITYLKKWT